MPDEYEKASPTVKMVQQVNNATCWLACCRMMYQWKNPNYTPVFDEDADPGLDHPPQDVVLRKLYDKALADSTVDL